ncbi:hypothetical protein B0T24DRAFT_83246 [Lasiosphaeria ovina]|uniref:Uncharacterized protein n=1 Tax=Lasiosphaeria ovina TaxID=92902 RepID=A0AAE0TYN9_9PEZI|nr:hypothetical protein B0T24DRAFT_83246 [Lasiosphaeria ovina]
MTMAWMSTICTELGSTIWSWARRASLGRHLAGKPALSILPTSWAAAWARLENKSTNKSGLSEPRQSRFNANPSRHCGAISVISVRPQVQQRDEKPKVGNHYYCPDISAAAPTHTYCQPKSKRMYCTNRRHGAADVCHPAPVTVGWHMGNQDLQRKGCPGQRKPFLKKKRKTVCLRSVVGHRTGLEKKQKDEN